MQDEYRLGFNYDGIIKLMYRVIVGFFAFRVGHYIYADFHKFATWIMSMDGVNASAIKEIHLTVALFISVSIGTIVTYKILLNIVIKYIITSKLRKKNPQSDYTSPFNSTSDGYKKY